MSPRRVTSADNPLVKRLVRLVGSSRERRRSGMCVLDGPHLVDAFSRSGATAEALVASDAGLARGEVRALFERVPAHDRIVLPDRLFAQVAAVATPVGILASVRVPDHGELPEPLEECVVLDAIQDNGNVGSILRTAAAAGIRRAIALSNTAFLWSPRVLRAGMGAHFGMQLHEGLSRERLARARSQLLVASGAGEADLYTLDLRKPTIWVFGNEGAGVDATLAQQAAHRVRIPMAAGTESLNVAAAAAICLFEQMRQRHASWASRPVAGS